MEDVPTIVPAGAGVGVGKIDIQKFIDSQAGADPVIKTQSLKVVNSTTSGVTEMYNTIGVKVPSTVSDAHKTNASGVYILKDPSINVLKTDF